jgi:hypothetical protein
MRIRRIASTTALALVVGATPLTLAAPAPDGGPYRVQMLYRTGGSLAPFDVTVEASSDNDLGMWFAIELFRPKGRWIERAGTGFGGYADIVGAPYPTFYGHPATSAVPRCPGQPGCAWPVPFDGSRGFVAKPTPTSRFYFVSAHANVRIVVDAPGWRLKDVPNPGFRRVFADRSQAVGASSTAVTPERFTAASAPGGRYGSAVFAYVACETTGYGTARLTGRGARVFNQVDTPPDELVCEPHRSDNGEYAYTENHTTWHLRGDVVGVGSSITRLVVFDFPKP